MRETIKVEILNRPHFGSDTWSYPEAKIDRAVAQGLINRYPMKRGFKVPVHVQMAHRQMLNNGGKPLHKTITRYVRNQDKKETREELSDYYSS